MADGVAAVKFGAPGIIAAAGLPPGLGTAWMVWRAYGGATPQMRLPKIS